MTFGQLGAGGEVEPFFGGGSGSGSFYESSLLVELNRLPAPPPGMHYQSYLAAVSPTGVGTSSRGNTITLDARGNGMDRLEAAQVGDFASFTHYLVVLEPERHHVHYRDVGAAERRLQEQVQGVLRRLTSAPACRDNPRPPPAGVAGAFVASGIPGRGAGAPGTCPRVIDSLRCGNWWSPGEMKTLSVPAWKNPGATNSSGRTRDANVGKILHRERGRGAFAAVPS